MGCPSRLAIDLTMEDTDNFDHDIQMADAIAESDNATAPSEVEESLKEGEEFCFGTVSTLEQHTLVAYRQVLLASPCLLQT